MHCLSGTLDLVLEPSDLGLRLKGTRGSSKKFGRASGLYVRVEKVSRIITKVGKDARIRAIRESRDKTL